LRFLFIDESCYEYEPIIFLFIDLLAAKRKKVVPIMPAKHRLLGMELRKVGI